MNIIYVKKRRKPEPEEPAPLNLIGHWKLDETSGTTAYDSSSSGKNGTLYNISVPSAWVSGHRGGALDFPGSTTSPYGSEVVVGTGSDFALTTYTVAGWFKTTKTSNYNVITSRHLYSTNRDWWVATWKSGASTHTTGALVWRTSTGVDLGSSSSKADGEWHHFAIVLNGSTDAKLYVMARLRPKTRLYPVWCLTPVQ